MNSILARREAPRARPSGAVHVLFRSHNRRGLGHMMRAINIAREIRCVAPDARIVLSTRNPSTGQFCPDDVEWVLESGRATDWAATVRAVDPDVVVYDTLIPGVDELACVPAAARVAYVMRRCNDERHDEILASGILDGVDVMVVPHDRDEFDRPIPLAVAERTIFTGPIVRSPDPGKAGALRSRYDLETAGRTIVSCAGGGGFKETAEPFFDAIWDAHARLAPRIPELRHVVVLGPHHVGERVALPGMSLVKSEPDLVDLFALADLVVSEGGYNAVHEILRAGVPGCFVPGNRRWDDQGQRVRLLETRGQAAVVAHGEPAAMGAQIADLAGNAERLAALRRRIGNMGTETGNRRAAEAILGCAAA